MTLVGRSRLVQRERTDPFDFILGSHPGVGVRHQVASVSGLRTGHPTDRIFPVVVRLTKNVPAFVTLSISRWVESTGVDARVAGEARRKPRVRSAVLKIAA